MNLLECANRSPFAATRIGLGTPRQGTRFGVIGGFLGKIFKNPNEMWVSQMRRVSQRPCKDCLDVTE